MYGGFRALVLADFELWASGVECFQVLGCRGSWGSEVYGLVVLEFSVQQYDQSRTPNYSGAKNPARR